MGDATMPACLPVCLTLAASFCLPLGAGLTGWLEVVERMGDRPVPACPTCLPSLLSPPVEADSFGVEFSPVCSVAWVETRRDSSGVPR